MATGVADVPKVADEGVFLFTGVSEHPAHGLEARCHLRLLQAHVGLCLPAVCQHEPAELGVRADLWRSSEGELSAEAEAVRAVAIEVSSAWREAFEQGSVKDAWIKPSLLQIKQRQ